MAAKPIDISVVVPVHNEELCVEEFVRRAEAALQALGRPYEIVVVSDGSTDRTDALLRQLCASHAELRAVLLSRNTGQCNAMYAGIQETTGECVVVMDGDLQHAPEEIHLLVRALDGGHALVSGTRTERGESLLLRRVPSAAANWMLRRVTGCPVRDMGGFKAMRGDIARALRLRAGHHRLLPALVWMRGGSVAEVAVSSPPRFAGQSHYGLSRSLDVLFDVVMLWFQSSFKSRPIYLFGRLGLVLLLVDVLLSAWLLYDKLVLKEPLTSRPMFFVVIMLFLAALFTLATGFMLELLSDTLNTVGRVRPYVVRERITHPSRGP
jgi:glycosyltransferase involved in cell wall biosynthesis